MHKGTLSGTNGSFTMVQECALIQLGQTTDFPSHTLYLGLLTAFEIPKCVTFTHACVHTLACSHVYTH